MNSIAQISTTRINLALAVTGFVVWMLISALPSGNETLDDRLLWFVGVPLMLIVNAVAAYFHPKKVVLKGMISASLQPVAAIVVSGEIGSVLPFGLILFLFLGWLYSVGGLIGAYKKTRLQSN
ncbi:MAG: hypothetical protein AB1600_10730, partial [Bacteroidota bacterium]